MEHAAGEHLGALLGETARAWRARLDERLRPLGLSQTRWLAILHLSKAEDGLSQNALASRLGISAASLSAQIDRLVRDGWVERRSHEHDRRFNTLVLSERARELSRQIQHTAAGLRKELLAGLDEADIRCCERTLEHILQRARQLTAADDAGMGA